MKKTSSGESFSGKMSPPRTGNMDFLFSMILFLVFILCSVFTILIGSRVYSNIRARNDAAFYSDTALSYITNKVRQADQSGFVGVRTIEDCDVLVLTSEYDGIAYETWIYTKNNSLLELFSEKDSGLTTDDGLAVMDCSPVTFSMEEKAGGNLLSISLKEPEDKTTGVQRAKDAHPSLRTAQILLRSSIKEGGQS